MFREDPVIREYEEEAGQNFRQTSYELVAGAGLEALSINYWYGIVGDSFQDAANEVDLYVDYPLQMIGYTVRNPEILAPVTTAAGAALLIDAGRRYYRASKASNGADVRRSVERSLDELEEELDP